MPGASVFVADRQFVEKLKTLAPQLTSRAYGWRSARPWVIAAVSIALAIAAGWAANISPAHWVAAMLPDRIRGSVGEKVMASMVQGRKECTAPEGRQALDRLVAGSSVA